MKKLAKRAAALLFAVALVMSMMVVFASAVEMDASYLSKEKCWTEAAKYVDSTGLSQPRIARELYTHALADNLAYVVTEFNNTPLCDLIDKNLRDRVLNPISTYLAEHGHVVQLGEDKSDLQKYVKSSVRELAYVTAWRHIDIYPFDRYYTIHSKLNWDKVIDVNGNFDGNGTKIQLYDSNGSRAQKFALYFKDGGWCNIFKKDTFQCLDVSGGVAESGVKVQLYEYNGTAAQDWGFIDAGNGYYYIKNRLGYYLDACGGSTDNGTQIWTYTRNQTDAQKWKLSSSWAWSIFEN